MCLEDFFFFGNDEYFVFYFLVQSHKIGDLIIDLFEVFFKVFFETLPHGIIIGFILAMLSKSKRVSL